MIGGSLARDLRERGLSDQLYAWDQDQRTLMIARARGWIDEGSDDLAALLPMVFDLIILATPVAIATTMLRTLKPLLRPQTLLSDVGSVKQPLLHAAQTVYDGSIPAQLVAAHPLAGQERSGIEAACSGLFEGKRLIITPHANNTPSALQRIKILWQNLGSTVSFMDPEHHDRVLAQTSHLPHLLSFALLDTLFNDNSESTLSQFSGSGLRDFTRIAASDATMWRDIFLANRISLLDALHRFQNTLTHYRAWIEREQASNLTASLRRVRNGREWFHAFAQPPQETVPLDLIIQPLNRLYGRVHIPGDKSISHRALIFAAIAEGRSEIHGLLEGQDNLATLQALRELGVMISGPENGRVVVHGVGKHGLQAPARPLDLGNSGTAIRLLSGLLAAQAFPSTLTGDASLCRRPMARVIEPLSRMGARIEAFQGEYAPLQITPTTTLQGIHYTLPVASAQVRSAILLAGLYARGATTVVANARIRDHSERMLQTFGYKVRCQRQTSILRGGGKLRAGRIETPGDLSSAAFLLVAGCICPDADLTLCGIGVNPTRDGVLRILQAMGACITIERQQQKGLEAVADIRVRSAPLHGITVPEAWIPLAIDEFPALFIAAACAQGAFRLPDATELRVKESDRLRLMIDGLQRLGASAEMIGDGALICGGEGFTGGEIDSGGDHRIAMAFTIAACRACAPVRILNCANIATSFPGFVTVLNRLGANIQVQRRNS